MKSIRNRACSLAWTVLVAAPAFASALEECLPSGEGAAVLRCLANEEIKVNGELASSEASAARRAREVEQATGRLGAHATLAKSVRDFAQYRVSQCAYVREMLADSSRATPAQAGCRVDLTRRRLRELTP